MILAKKELFASEYCDRFISSSLKHFEGLIFLSLFFFNKMRIMWLWKRLCWSFSILARLRWTAEYSSRYFLRGSGGRGKYFKRVETPEEKYPSGILGRWSSFLRIRTQMNPDRIWASYQSRFIAMLRNRSILFFYSGLF